MTRPWQALVSLLGCLALITPLLFVLGRLRESDTLEVPGQARLIPILGIEDHTRLLTYHRYCSKQSDCEHPLGCYFDIRHGHYCTDSNCMTDVQCPEGQRCSTLTTILGGPRVKLCAPIGPRQEGEHCWDLPRNPLAACTADLRCSGEGGFCARDCTLNEPDACPEGFFCADVKPEPSCLPTCETRGCPDGQQCIPSEEGASTCAKIYGPNCLETPCPKGRKCEVFPDARFPGKVWAECIERCSDKSPNPTCAEGQVCDRYHCLQACDPNGPNPCAEGYHCDRRKETLPWSCQPDSWPDR